MGYVPGPAILFQAQILGLAHSHLLFVIRDLMHQINSRVINFH